MKILHIVPTYLPAYRYGGPIYSVHELNKGLVASGVDVTVYTTNVDGPNNLPVKEDLIDGVRINYFQSSFPRGWFYSKDLKKALSENIKDFDLVHITSVFLSVSYLGAKYAKKFNKPYIISPRGSLIPELISKKNFFLKQFYIWLFEKKNLSGASAIHFTTKYEEDMYKELSLPLKKSIIIPNGIDMIPETTEQDKIKCGEQFRDKFDIPQDADIVLFLGRLNWKKGFDTLAPAFKKIYQENSKSILVIAGSDGDEPGYKEQIKNKLEEARVMDGVRFVDDLRGSEKTAAYETATVYVMPSYSENFGIAAVESMAHGTAVVVTNKVGISSDIKESGSGVVINKNADALANETLKLLHNKALAHEMGENGKKLVRKKYVWNEIVKSWITEYTKLVTN